LAKEFFAGAAEAVGTLSSHRDDFSTLAGAFLVAISVYWGVTTLKSWKRTAPTPWHWARWPHALHPDADDVRFGLGADILEGFRHPQQR